MNHTQYAINSIGQNIKSLETISAFIARSKNYQYLTACISCLAGTGWFMTSQFFAQDINAMAGLSGTIVAYGFTIYSAFSARACEQQVNQIKQLEKDMKMGKRELKLLAEKVSLRSSAEATI